MPIKRFIIRVYGLIHRNWDEVLLAEEFHFNTFMRKFPGGGLEFGEGPAECLMREIREELGVSLQLGEHLHTTSVFIQSAFNEEHQVIGIYYMVDADDELIARFRDDYSLPEENGVENFRWIHPESISLSDITFAADQQAFEVFLRKRSERKGGLA
jgi:8-oxo-dGTP pyrophosphatase MutT (NUDIX family)